MKKKSGFEKFYDEKKGSAKKEELRQQKRKWKKELEEQKEKRKRPPASASFPSPVSRPKRTTAPKQDAERPVKKSAHKTKTGVAKPQSSEFVPKPRSSRAKTAGPQTPSGTPKRKSLTLKPKPEAESKPVEQYPKTAETRIKKAAGRTPAPEKRHGKPERSTKPERTIKPERSIKNAKPAAHARPEEMPLNKYIAHSGVCSRREAADIIKSGKVKVNGALVLEPGHKVTVADEVRVAGKKVHPVADLVYILLNKPKDYLTTTDDPQQRKTVLDLIQQATSDRVYPVGRLDRNTSGVLLLTNDGDLAQQLTHPSHEIKKVYAVTLDKPLERRHFDDILKGVNLEDGPAYVDVLAYTDPSDKTKVGIELHSGRNRIVRRIFEHLGYDVKALDRVMFAGLTKKNVERGKWRFLTEREVRDLKYFKKGKK